MGFLESVGHRVATAFPWLLLIYFCALCITVWRRRRALRAQLQRVHRLPDVPVDRGQLHAMVQRVVAGEPRPDDLVDLGNEQHRHAYQAARDGFRDIGGFDLEHCCRCGGDLPLNLADGEYGSSPWSVCFDDEYREHIRGGEHFYRGQLCQRCAEIVLNAPAPWPCCDRMGFVYPGAPFSDYEICAPNDGYGDCWLLMGPNGTGPLPIDWCPFCGSRLPPCP